MGWLLRLRLRMEWLLLLLLSLCCPVCSQQAQNPSCSTMPIETGRRTDSEKIWQQQCGAYYVVYECCKYAALTVAAINRGYVMFQACCIRLCADQFAIRHTTNGTAWALHTRAFVAVGIVTLVHAAFEGMACTEAQW